jgi:hypothetical protein
LEEGEKDPAKAIEEFEKSNAKFQHLDHKVASTKVWVGGLVQHIQLMAHGDGIMTFPLPIDNLATLLVGQPFSFSLIMCPICTFFFACTTTLLLQHVDHLPPFFLKHIHGDQDVLVPNARKCYEWIME